MRYSNGSYLNGFAVTAMAYSGNWFATSQIAQRAVDSGLIDRFGTLNPTDGGSAQRYSLSGRWHETTADTATRVNAYVIKSGLTLYNDFTFNDEFITADYCRDQKLLSYSWSNRKERYALRER